MIALWTWDNYKFVVSIAISVNMWKLQSTLLSSATSRTIPVGETCSVNYSDPNCRDPTFPTPLPTHMMLSNNSVTLSFNWRNGRIIYKTRLPPVWLRPNWNRNKTIKKVPFRIEKEETTPTTMWLSAAKDTQSGDSNHVIGGCHYQQEHHRGIPKLLPRHKMHFFNHSIFIYRLHSRWKLRKMQ